MPVDPQLADVLKMIEAGTPMHAQTPAEARAALGSLAAAMRAPANLVPVAATEDITVAGGDGELPARVYRPEGEGPFPTVAFFHGGGFVIGSVDTHDNLARRLCRDANAVVVSVDYRLAPEHPFPAAVEDAVAATRDLLGRLEQFGGDGRLAVAGDSAGGNLSAVAAQQVPGLAAQFLIYAATDISGRHPSRTENAHGYLLDQPTIEWFFSFYAPDGDPTDVRLSPLAAESFLGLPPAVVVTAEYDPLRDEAEDYARALERAGVPVTVRRYDEMLHGFMDMGAYSPAALRAMDDAIALFAKVLHA